MTQQPTDLQVYDPSVADPYYEYESYHPNRRRMVIEKDGSMTEWISSKAWLTSDEIR